MKPAFNRKTERLECGGVRNGAINTVAGKEARSCAGLTDENTPIIISFAEIWLLNSGVFLNHFRTFLVATVEIGIRAGMANQFYLGGV